MTSEGSNFFLATVVICLFCFIGYRLISARNNSDEEDLGYCSIVWYLVIVIACVGTSIFAIINGGGSDFLPLVAIPVCILGVSVALDVDTLNRRRKLTRNDPQWKVKLFYNRCVGAGFETSEEVERIASSETTTADTIKKIAKTLNLSTKPVKLKQAFEAGEVADDQEYYNDWLTDDYYADELYKLFQKHGIEDFSSPADLARMKLVVEQEDIPLNEEELKQVYARGKARKEGAVIAAENQKQAELRAREEHAMKENTRYIECIGRDKMIQMYLDRAELARQNAACYQQALDDLKNGSMDYYNAIREHERSWAVHGGIASGIAGGAAGLAIASDVQRRNAEKRARNDASLYRIAQLQNDAALHFRPKIESCKTRAQKSEQDAESAKVLLVQDMPEAELLARLKPVTKECTVSETGTVLLTVSTKQVRNIIIYEKVNAMVDGSFKAILRVDGKKVGEAYLTMPAEASRNNNELLGICCNLPTVPAEKYSISYEPHHLWAIEYK